jgi:ribosome-associated toxin RatA of RatAB toxin-antitoxin module
MSEQTSSTIEIEAPAEAVMDEIADVEAYPDWTGSVKEVEVLERGADGRPARATFVLDAGVVKDTYTLSYAWNGNDSVSWTLIEAQILTAMDGSYRLSAVGEGTTRVEYVLTLDLKMPMIGMLRRKAEKVVTDTALKELKRRVEGE